jgi:NodT family efflux transporter outer membrane factor (OMF) lipoprotein
MGNGNAAGMGTQEESQRAFAASAERRTDGRLGQTGGMPASRRLAAWWRFIGTSLCVVALAGCTVGPNFVKPKSGLDAAVLSPRQDRPGTIPTSDAAVPEQWWSLFHDPVLAGLEQQAQAENLGLQMAFERIEASRAVLGIASSPSLPDVDTGASYARSALSKNGKFAALDAPTRPTNFWHLGFDFSWEVDLWGRARREREGAAAALEATEYDREAVRVALVAEVAGTYLKLRGTQAQLGIAKQNLGIAQHILRLVQSRVRNGVATDFESASARAQLAEVEASIPQLVQQRDRLMNALALLLSEKPRALDAELVDAMPLPALPISVPVGVSSELARRRPDIQRAAARLHAATAAIGVATADFYPRIGLKAQIGLEAFESEDLLDWDSHFFSVGPSVYLPIFQGGRLKRRLELTEARQKEAALAYRQTVLLAWHEVDNALDACSAQQRRHQELLIAFRQNERALRAARRGYQQGVADYLRVLSAQDRLLASQTLLNASATDTALAVVELYKALGGGWKPGAVDAAAGNNALAERGTSTTTRRTQEHP